MPGDLHTMTHTMEWAYGSSNEILSEWDAGPTYLVQRLWGTGGPSYMSKSSLIVNLENLGS